MSDIVEKKPVESRSPNMLIALGVILFSVIEAVISFFVIFKPLFIDSIYHNTYLDENGYEYTVSFFGNLFASEAQRNSGTVMLSLSGAVGNIALIYLFLTVVPILLALMFRKGFAFAKSGLTTVFGAKTVIGLMPLLVPFDNVRTSMWIFGVADAVICLCACAFFVYLSNVEYADDMLLDGGQIKDMIKRAKFGGMLFLLMTVWTVFEKFAMSGYGTDRSVMMGKDGQKLIQGYVLVIILAVSLICAIMYIRGTVASLYFFAAFGGAAAFSNIYALVRKRSVFIIVCVLVAAAVAALSFIKIRKRVFRKADADEKKPALFVRICAAALIVCFFLSVIAVLRWDKKIYTSFAMGAMDYMYLIVYGGLTLFLALSLLGGVGASKWGTLALYIVVGASNFSTVFNVFGTRSSLVASNPGYRGYDYIVIGILFILSILCCLTVIILFAYKEIDNYMYSKRNT